MTGTIVNRIPSGFHLKKGISLLEAQKSWRLGNTLHWDLGGWIVDDNIIFVWQRAGRQDIAMVISEFQRSERPTDR